VLSAIAWALFAAVQPVGILAYIVILTRGGRRDGWGFVVGWVLCALVVMGLTLAVSGDAQHATSPTVAAAGWVQVGLGALALIALAVRRLRGPRAAPPAVEEPVTTTADSHTGPFGAAVVAALTQGWPIVAAAVAAAVGATSAGAGRVLALAVVILVCSSTYLAAQVFAGFYPEATEVRLRTLRRRIEADRQRVIDLALAGIGVWLLANGILAQLAS
jgi:Sap-like sulfolipid-1-addressing protein